VKNRRLVKQVKNKNEHPYEEDQKLHRDFEKAVKN